MTTSHSRSDDDDDGSNDFEPCEKCKRAQWAEEDLYYCAGCEGGYCQNCFSDVCKFQICTHYDDYYCEKCYTALPEEDMYCSDLEDCPDEDKNPHQKCAGCGGKETVNMNVIIKKIVANNNNNTKGKKRTHAIDINTYDYSPYKYCICCESWVGANCATKFKEICDDGDADNKYMACPKCQQQQRQLENKV